MPGTREGFVDHLWQHIINPLAEPDRLENIIRNCRPDSAFARVGPAIERALAAGVPAEDICLIMRSTAYETVFGTLYAFGEPGVDGGVIGLHELMSSSKHAKW